MIEPPKSPTTLIKLASLVAHVQEALGPNGHGMDLMALKGLAEDEEIKAWLETVPKVFLPLKR